MVELSRMPERSVSLISDFHEKIAKVCETCSGADITNFSGVPSWNLMMLKAILDYTGKRNISEVWPNLELFMIKSMNQFIFCLFGLFRRMLPSGASVFEVAKIIPPLVFRKHIPSASPALCTLPHPSIASSAVPASLLFCSSMSEGRPTNHGL